jgi:hypothetical protein
MFNKKQTQSQITGFDVLLAMTSRLDDEDDVPFADQYLTLLTDFVTPREHVLFGHQAVAQSALQPHELVPANIVKMATTWTVGRGDLQATKEVADVGARLAAVWPRFLLSTTDGHPELTNRHDTPRAKAEEAADAELVLSITLKDNKFTDAVSILEELRRCGYVLTAAQP